MKIRLLSALIALILCSGFTEAAHAQENEVFALRCDEQNFSLLCGDNCTVSTRADGATIRFDGASATARVEISVIIDEDTEGFDASEYFFHRPEDMEREDGVSYTIVEAYSRGTMGTSTLYGASYSFDDCGETAYRYEMLLDTGSQLVRFSCFYRRQDGDAPVSAMIQAIQTYQPSADYYRSVPSAATANASPAPTRQPAAAGSVSLRGYRVESAEPILAPLTPYDGGFFSITLPAGWQIQTMGQYSAFGFRAWNPENPDYEIFYYGTLTPFNKSEAAKAWNQSNAWAGFPYDYYGDAPVVAPDSVEDLFDAWNAISPFVRKYTGTMYLPGFSFPALNRLAVMETLPIRTYFADIASKESILRASFQSDRGTNCFGKLCASLVDVGSYELSGVDMLPLSAISVTGVLAPQDTFVEVEQALTQALYSLTFSDAYIQEANEYARRTGETAMANNAALQATYDSYNASWRARQTSYDIVSQKNSDATLGYDRLYDPDTGEVYRAEVGFYERYDLNRDQFSNPDLQIVTGATEQYYLGAVDYYIQK